MVCQNAYDLKLEDDGELRFYTTSWNLPSGRDGPNGPLELVDGGQGNVNQNIYSCNSDGTGVTSYPTSSTRVGKFTYHPDHDHIHYDDYADYTATQQCVNGNSPRVRTGDKVSFCIMDTDNVDFTVPGAPGSAQYTECKDSQGMSVGWGDTYKRSTPGQYVKLDGDVVDGPPTCWKLCININPGPGKLQEQSPDDNECCMFLQFEGYGSTSFEEVASCSCNDEVEDLNIEAVNSEVLSSEIHGKCELFASFSRSCSFDALSHSCTYFVLLSLRRRR